MISPKAAMWLNVAALVLSVLASGAWWVDLLGAHTAGIVTGVLASGVAAINLVLHSLANRQEGPLTKALKGN